MFRCGLGFKFQKMSSLTSSLRASADNQLYRSVESIHGSFDQALASQNLAGIGLLMEQVIFMAFQRTCALQIPYVKNRMMVAKEEPLL